MPRKRTEAPKPSINPNVYGLRKETVQQPVTETLKTNYMPYAMSVIVSRAIPEIDGFKPSHRKILYTMYKMGLLNGARTKSANIVGQTMKLNPHGDAAIYDTMVRLSQGYGALLHPFVDSKGNFGKVYSRDMAWAAPRYTEAKLMPICTELFTGLDQDAVDFAPNYDNTMLEPTLLPTTFPNILVSANQGIAVGMASQICGFNLNEVCDTTIAFLKDPECVLSDTLSAPDLPTGGELIYDQKALEEIYQTGRGGVKVRARWRFIKKDNVIEIYEIPYSATVEAIMDKVADLIKNNKIREISDMRDETDLSGLKLAIDIKRGTDPEKLMAKLFKLTPLQDTISCNFNILINGMPRVMGVREVLGEWCGWRIGCVRRITNYTLQKKREKLHLLEGLKAILLNINKAIRIIRETERDDQVVPNLMSGFKIDEIQAEFVAEMKLRNINKEYILKRTDEITFLEKDIADLSDLAGSDRRIKSVIINELKAVKKKYGMERRTSIINETADFAEEDFAPDYLVTVFLSQHGYFKKITPQSLRMSGEQKYREDDQLSQTEPAMNNEEIMFFTNKCQVYKSRLPEFPDTKASALGEYLPAKLGMDDDERIVYMYLPKDYAGQLLFVFENGKAVRIPASAYTTASNRRKLANAYSDKSPLAAMRRIHPDSVLQIISNQDRVVVISANQIPEKTTRTAAGAQVMKLKGSAKVVCVEDGQGKRPCRVIPSLGRSVKEGDSEDEGSARGN